MEDRGKRARNNIRRPFPNQFDVGTHGKRMLDIHSGQLSSWFSTPQTHIQTRAHILLRRRVRRPLSHTCRAERAVKPRALIKQLRFLTYLSRTHPASACIRWDSSTCSCRKCSCTCACRAAASGHTRLGLKRTGWKQKMTKPRHHCEPLKMLLYAEEWREKVNQATVTSRKHKTVCSQCLHFNAGYIRAVKSLLSKVTGSLTMAGCVNFWGLNNLTCDLCLQRTVETLLTHTWFIIPSESSSITPTSSKYLGLYY